MQDKKTFSSESLLLIFKLDKDNFGIRGEEVREVVDVSEVTPVPRAPSFIAGIINVRGKIITILDLALLLGLPPFPVDRNSKILSLEHKSVDVGILIKPLEKAKRLSSDFLKASLKPPAKNEAKGRFIEGTIELGKIPVNLLDVDGLFKFVDEYNF